MVAAVVVLAHSSRLGFFVHFEVHLALFELLLHHLHLLLIWSARSLRRSHLEAGGAGEVLLRLAAGSPIAVLYVSGVGGRRSTFASFALAFDLLFGILLL